ncbi:hypothetical protein OOK31_14940 [Streptomyces sp. NBC_00249]|uniref:hypothetical protein n=1 Tax=Streptomyces sp. NBC_00249 TaxID=2975690 RepID=UPI002252AA2D|nr:hypothetical protein [Streptomyces sp. NBC_00249]MCX5195181.1 hypothetical protein [Streptomyces sp. NBC_00249]
MTSPSPGREENPPARPTRPAPPARPGAAAARSAAGAGWVRTRLRAAPGSVLLSMLLAFVAVLLAAALPRALDRGSDQALRAYLADRGPSPTSLYVSSLAKYGTQTPQELDSVLAALRRRVDTSGFRMAAEGPVHGSMGTLPRTLLNPGLAAPEEIMPQMQLVFLPEVASHARIVAGRWPSGGAPGGPVPVAMAKSAADTLGVKLGMVLDAGADLSGPMTAEVVGFYAAEDAADVYWTELPCPTEACHPKGPGWYASALVGPEALDRIAPWGSKATDFWRLPVDTGVLRAHELPAVSDEVASFVAGLTATELAGETGRQDLRVTSELPRLFAEARARRQAAAPLAAIGPAGLAGVTLVVLCLAAGLAGARRESELLLLRARGGSRAGIVRRLLGEGAVTVLPAAALAAWLPVVLLPTPRLAPGLIAAGAVALAALLAFPVRAFVLLSPPRGPAPRRRLVAELLVLAATVAAVVEVRRRGVAPPGADVDPLLVAAPLLLALSGGLLLARIQPVLVGSLARAAGRRPGLIGFLGLARAARGAGDRARPSVLPLIALLLAVTTGGFGATVLASVDSARLSVARAGIGGDARVAAPLGAALPEAFVKAADALPGVRTSLGMWLDPDAFVFGTDRGFARTTVIVADPAAYAELAKAVGRGLIDPAALSAPVGADAPVPALFSKELAGQSPDGVYRLRLGNGEELRAKSAGTVQGTPAPSSVGSAIIVLPAGPVTARVPQAARPTHWFALGSVQDGPLKELLRATAPGGTADGHMVRTSGTDAARLAADPLQHAAQRLFWASLAGAAGFAVLAVLLTLVRTAPERGALLARLRTMGLRPRQGVALIVAESLPQALAAALGGGLVAAGAAALLGPSVDLSALVGSAVPVGLRLTAWPVLSQALGLAALVAVAVLVEAAVSGRRQITTELRAGDR